MKQKTSITITETLLIEIDKLIKDSGNRSAFIEEAAWYYLNQIKNGERDRNDSSIINRTFRHLNEEAGDVLSYLVEL
jgi:metal-responsive CopG/Arc/MetJ family transcriptional regulator